MSEWSVLVGNLGTVTRGDERAMRREFNTWCAVSRSGVGRASGESVTLLDAHGEIAREFIGRNDKES